MTSQQVPPAGKASKQGKKCHWGREQLQVLLYLCRGTVSDGTGFDCLPGTDVGRENVRILVLPRTPPPGWQHFIHLLHEQRVEYQPESLDCGMGTAGPVFRQRGNTVSYKLKVYSMILEVLFNRIDFVTMRQSLFFVRF